MAGYVPGTIGVKAQPIIDLLKEALSLLLRYVHLVGISFIIRAKFLMECVDT